jgi:hypothetical protein
MAAFKKEIPIKFTGTLVECWTGSLSLLRWMLIVDLRWTDYPQLVDLMPLPQYCWNPDVILSLVSVKGWVVSRNALAG